MLCRLSAWGSLVPVTSPDDLLYSVVTNATVRDIRIKC